MSKYLKCVAGVFGVALLLSAIASNSAIAGNGPPTRDINVRVIAICAAPESVEPHDGGDGEVCLCFGRFFNGFNATGLRPNGRCARSQVGPFCFVDTIVGPLFWKQTVRRQSGPRTVVPGQVVQTSVECPPGKMVLSCEGAVTVGNTREVAANVASNTFPTADGLACRHVARADREATCPVFPGDGVDNDPFDPDLPCHGPALSYTDNLDGTFTDNNTGDTWEKKDNNGGVHDVGNTYDWTDGVGNSIDPDGTLFLDFLDKLNNTCRDNESVDCTNGGDADCAGVGGPCGFAGFRDWCIPNVKKLQSLVDYGTSAPAIDPSLPGLTASSVYWSATTLASNSIGAWFVNFDDGFVNFNVKTPGDRARAVRPCP